MSTIAPPPLPGGKPRRTSAASFVDVLGKLSVLLAVVGVLYALVQLVALLLIPAGFMDDFLAGEYEFLPALPSLLHWLLPVSYTHLDVYKRQPWGKAIVSETAA